MTRTPASSAPPTSAARSASPAGWRAAATTAGSSSSTCATAAASCQLVVDPSRAPDAHALAEQVRPEYVLAVTGVGRRPLAGDGEPQPADRRDRGPGRRPSRSSTAPRRRRSRWSRRSRWTSTRRSASSTATSTCAARPCSPTSSCATPPRRPRATYLNANRFIEVETPDLTQVVAGGREGLPRPLAPAAAPLLRAAAEPADVQADPHGGRHGPVLPVRALLPRRGPARRPPAGAHADRHRDVVPRRARDPRPARGPHDGHLRGRGGDAAGHAAAAPHLRRGHAAVRLGQAGPAVRPRDRRAQRDVRGERVQGVPRRRRRRRRGAGRPGARRRFPQPGPDRQAHRARQGARRQGHGLRVRGGGPRPARPHRQVPRRGRAGGAGGEGRRRARRPRGLRRRRGARRRRGPRRAAPRAHRAARRPSPSARWSLLWVDEFPLFEIDEETGQLTYGHNPFSLLTAEHAAAPRERPAGACAAPSTTWC